jgi:hypothetical protein
MNSIFSGGMDWSVAASKPRWDAINSGGRWRIQLFKDTSTNSGALTKHEDLVDLFP